VQLSAASSKTATVAYTTGNGTATAPSDYTSTSGTLAFNPGQTSTTFTVSIVDDNLDETDETVNLMLNTPNNAALGPTSSAILTIADNDASLPIVSIGASDTSAAETGPDSGTLTVTRDGSTATDLAVHYTVSGSASTSDYNPLAGNVVIPAGQASATITVTPIDDTAIEGNETVTLILLADPSYSVDANGSATVTIADDDISSAPSWSVYLPIIWR
jgi:hypothetical protein